MSQDHIVFARALANPEKLVRDHTVLQLRKYVASLDSLSDMEMLKLWKALFYCVWLSDKPNVQNELCLSLADIISVFQSTSLSFKYVRMFLRTILREWHNLDQYRLNKFYTLVRVMIRSSLQLLYGQKFPKKATSQFLSALQEELLMHVPNGLRFHVTDIYLDELWEATNGDISTAHFLACIEPFITALKSTDDTAYHSRIVKRIFNDYISKYSQQRDGTPSNGNEDAKIFKNVSLPALQAEIFEVASDEHTREGHRQKLYSLHKEFQAATKMQHVDKSSLSMSMSMSSERKASDKKSKSKKRKADAEEEASVVESANASSKALAIVVDDVVVKVSKKSKKGAGKAPLTVEHSSEEVSKESPKGTSNGKSAAPLSPPAVTTPHSSPGPVSVAEELFQKKQLFIASPKFVGSKPGYVFKKVCVLWHT